MRRILKLLTLFQMGGFLYYCMESVWRGYSHWTMYLLGGFIFLLLDGMNEVLSWKTPLLIQGLIGMIIIYTLEFVTGCIVNLWLGWGVWDYSDKSFNLIGQIWIGFAPLWFILSIFGIVFGDVCRWLVMGEENPRYKII